MAKILMAIDGFYPKVGGAENQCLRLSEKLLEKGCQVEVFTMRSPRSLPVKETVKGIKVHRIFGWPVRFINLLHWIVSLLWHSRRFDVIHVHLMSVHTIASVVAGRLLGKPIIVKIANSGARFDLKIVDEIYGWPLNTWIKQSVSASSRIIAISESIKTELIEFGIPETKILRIPNGISIPDNLIKPDKKYLRKELGLHPSKCIVMRLGTLKPKKGLEELVKAWEVIYRECNEVLLLSVGGDKEIPAWEERTAYLKESVKFISNKPENLVFQYLMASDIFVLPSRAEGLSNALLEAQLCKLPSVVTAVGGNTDVIDDGVNGYVVEVNKPNLLAKKLLKLIKNPSIRIQMSEKTHGKLKKFDINLVADHYVSLYKLLLSS